MYVKINMWSVTGNDSLLTLPHSSNTRKEHLLLLCCKLEVVVIFFRYQVRSYEILLRVFSLSLRIIKNRFDAFLLL